MTEPFSPDGPRQYLADLCHLVRERAAAEVDIAERYALSKEETERLFQQSQRSLTVRYHADKASAEEEYNTSKEAIAVTFDDEYNSTEEEYEKVRTGTLARFETEREAAQQELQEARWEVTAMSEAARGGSNLNVKDIVGSLEKRWQDLHAIHQQAVELLQHRGQWRQFPEPQITGPLLENHPAHRFTHAMELAKQQYDALQRQFISRFFGGAWPLVLFLLVWALCVYPWGQWFGWENWRWVVFSGVTAFGGFVVIGGILFAVARRRSAEAYLALRRTLLEAGLDKPAVLDAARKQCQRLYAGIHARQTAEMKKAEDRFAASMADAQRRKEEEVQRADDTYPPKLSRLIADRDRGLKETEEKHARTLREVEQHFASESQRFRTEHDSAMQENEQRYRREWDALVDRWRSGIERFRAAAAQIGGVCRRGFPDWSSDDWTRWSKATEIPTAVPLGQGDVEMAKIKGGVPSDPRLEPPQTDFRLPLLLPFPQLSLLLLKATGAGRSKAVEAMQAAMLRMLTALPPGKVRFTIVDPVGLGEDFSAFMHLADYDEQLVASRIWTDSGHIEQRLADLTKHMEDVIQVYLRKEFPSIREYNAFAGEMAEPYRVLVVANFPANFSEAAAHRIKSIVASGARCGVFVLLSVDTKLPMPHHFHLPDIEPDAMVLRWDERPDGGQFVWEHPNYGPVPVGLDPPPPPERFRDIVRTMGNEAKHLGRVEVPFHCIIPAEPDWWSEESRGGIDVPLGRAGAMKLQHLDLGSGTSQHVLVSGKTGSGKSTLLHVLITNMALRYSPDEIELYLVDFKKGVEFKAYARYELPHARVVAIESEREFGLSVLQRLDGELRTRGDMFRKLGVQDLKGFRTAQPDAKLPRVMLIVDEFQELFVEDDRIAQESSLLLDRLVRQGRAFGIHVLLGSQTLGGAYSLARSTIGQMAVRIALQCSESDAHLILSEDNTAARLLTRPGEAIYNDANGLYEGNHPFQIVWLPDNQRDDYLQRIRDLAAQRRSTRPPPIVFEGNILADPRENKQLQQLLDAPAWPASCPMPQAWLGSAVAIKEPTAAVFLRQNGSNLLMVGHREEAALGVMATALVSLATQHPCGKTGTGFERSEVPVPVFPGGSGTKFYILDGTRADAPEVGFWNGFVPTVPHAVTLANPRNVADPIAELAAELLRRQQEADEHAPPLYLFVYNFSRFRDLRREDDFGYSSDESETPNPSKQFAAILRDGPAFGIHTLIWCDTYANVSRMLDRQGLRDFEMRVLFQMNATDSSSLMDAPDASKLGVHRAVFYDEGQGRAEKFRPYGLPTGDWLAAVKRQLHSRAGG